MIIPLFFLPGTDERMEKSGDAVGFFWPENSLVHVSHILDGEECMGVCSLDMLRDPGDIGTVDQRKDHLDTPPGTRGIERGYPVIF